MIPISLNIISTLEIGVQKSVIVLQTNPNVIHIH